MEDAMELGTSPIESTDLSHVRLPTVYVRLMARIISSSPTRLMSLAFTRLIIQLTGKSTATFSWGQAPLGDYFTGEGEPLPDHVWRRCQSLMRASHSTSRSRPYRTWL